MKPVSRSLWSALQLVAAVLLATAISIALGIGEFTWAAMSVLIVQRPGPGSTWQAGRQRILGTLVGSMLGVAVVLLRGHLASPMALLACLVALLGGASAFMPPLRTAAIAALIVATVPNSDSGGALALALARSAQILIGIGCALLVSLVPRPGDARRVFWSDCAGLLQRMAGPQPVADMRERLTRLVMSGQSLADGERAARLTGQVHQDVAAIGRLVALLPGPAGPAQGIQVMAAVGRALEQCAAALAAGELADTEMLSGYAPDLAAADAAAAHASGDSIRALLFGPVTLLRRDLLALTQLARQAARAPV